MPYVLPQTIIRQELLAAANPGTRRGSAFICGGHAQLIRFDVEDERNNGFLGYYEPALRTCYSWPERPAGGIVDTSYTKVHVQNALLRYFQDFIGSSSLIQTISGKANRVRSETLSFRGNGDDYPLSAIFQDRDVQVGDIAKVRATVGLDTFTLWSYVAGFVGEVVAATVDAAAGDPDNAASQAAPAATNEYVGDTDVQNCVDISAVDQTSYDGLADGDINETYTITVIQSSTGGDPTTALLRISSASGHDDIVSVAPEAFGVPTEIGSRGLTVTFTDTNTPACSQSAENNEVSDLDFLVGQVWEVTCGQAFTAPTATSGGTYTGDQDVVYIVEVSRGGVYADLPQISVTTDRGIDASGPTTVPAAGTAVAVGTKGVTVQFDQTALRAGDRYTIAVTAEAEGAMQTIILGHNLPSEVQAAGVVEVDLSLFIKKDIEVSEARFNVPGQVNWTQSATELCLEEDITATDSSWLDNGELDPLPVISEESKGYGKVFVTARYWLSELCASLESISDVSELDDAVPGVTHPDNPLKYALLKCLQNSNGTPVYFMSVCDPDDPDSWLTVLEVIDGRPEVYGIVPLTRNATVWSEIQAHVNSQSSPTIHRFRVAWLSLGDITIKALLTAATSTDEEEVLATVQDDPDTSGTQYTIVEVPADNANFLTLGVRAGDTLRTLYSVDSLGDIVYEEFQIDAVLSENSLRLVTGLDAAINTPQKIEVHRSLTGTEQAEELALHGFQDRRVRLVWPHQVGADGMQVEGYFLCAALSGLSSGIAPHQGMTRLEINGFEDADESSRRFNRTQLNVMAESGIWIVTQDLRNGEIFSRHAVTTGDTDDYNQREEMITRNADDISFFFEERYEPYIGVSNAVPSVLSIMRSETQAGIQELRGRNLIQRLGGQLVDGEIRSLRPHAIDKGTIIVILQLTLPSAINVIDVTLIF